MITLWYQVTQPAVAKHPTTTEEKTPPTTYLGYLYLSRLNRDASLYLYTATILDSKMVSIITLSNYGDVK